MRSLQFSSLLLAAASFVSATPFAENHGVSKRATTIAPKVFIIDMFEPEGAAWWGIDEFDVLAQNITIPGLSPLFPEVHCTADGDICQVITGESEINAASSISALVLSSVFDLTKTYFFVAGIAGVNPEVATTGSVTFARYAVQVALQYEFDIRDLPGNFTTGYIPFNTDNPADYPAEIYGTEVFELNLALRDVAMAFASTAALNDTADAAAYRAKYAAESIYAAAAQPPSVVGCDVATSDVYYSGTLLSEAFENTTRIWTNGSGVYCSTAQEDNATLEAILRAAKANMTDYSRVIVMRTSSDFDRPPPGISEIQNLLYVDQGGFSPAIANIYLAGIKVVMGILDGWDSTFEAGVVPNNYVGDIFDTLGGTPDYGLPSFFISKRDVAARAPEGNMRIRRAQHSAERRAAMLNEV
ncbi:purine nucleoside permease-domain-containing protein [Exophiala viscosa]|uniref:Purine nucleoside permease-domain-containing protein n=1 Tax=Exophiala viscosa TaxID=2486360 RepID=A0AAN6DY13_9EURO|nr:purine nucleoside permease-domain-containing protein [Exophiala viscosa]